MGTGGSNWLSTMTPDVAGVSVDPLSVVVGTDEGPGGVVAPGAAGTAAGDLATVDGVGAVAAWLEQAAQSPIIIAIAAFFIEASFWWKLNRLLRRPLHSASKSPLGAAVSCWAERPLLQLL
jgi:hypothetical protein